MFAVRVGQPASCCLFFLLFGLFFLLLQKTNQTATTKTNVNFDHCYVTTRLHQVCLLFPDWPMNEELVSVRLYSMWDEEASRISVVLTDEAFVEVVLEKPRDSPPKGSVRCIPALAPNPGSACWLMWSPCNKTLAPLHQIRFL